jgi:hypothetical protein
MTRRIHCLPVVVLAILLVSCGVQVDENAASTLRQAGKAVELTVLPPLVRKGQDVAPSVAQGERLVAGLVDAGLSRTWPGDAWPALSPGWKASGKSLWKRTVKQSRSWLEANPQPGSHTLVTEYLLGTRMVVAVHVLIFDAEGRLAYGRVLNSGDGLYMETAPIGEADCTNLVLSALRQDLELSIKR